MADDFRRMFRRDSPATSIEAARRIFDQLNRKQQAMLLYAIGVGDAGFTHEDAIRSRTFERWGPSTVRTRVAELRDRGLIRDTGKIKLHPPNRREFTVWAFVPLDDRPEPLPMPSNQPDLFR
jgi:hypothetical protein